MFNMVTILPTTNHKTSRVLDHEAMCYVYLVVSDTEIVCILYQPHKVTIIITIYIYIYSASCTSCVCHLVSHQTYFKSQSVGTPVSVPSGNQKEGGGENKNSTDLSPVRTKEGQLRGSQGYSYTWLWMAVVN